MSTKYWRVRHKGDLTGNSDWSEPTSFEGLRELKFVYTSADTSNEIYRQIWSVASGTPINLPKLQNIACAVPTPDGLGLLGRFGNNAPFKMIRFDPVLGVTGEDVGATYPSGNDIASRAGGLRVIGSDLFVTATSLSSSWANTPVRAFIFNSASGITSEVPSEVDRVVGSTPWVLRDGNVMYTSHVNTTWSFYKVTKDLVHPRITIEDSAVYTHGAELTLDNNFIIMATTQGIRVFEWSSDTGWKDNRADLEATFTIAGGRNDYRNLEIRKIKGVEYIFFASSLNASDNNNRRYHVYSWDSSTGATPIDVGLDISHQYTVEGFVVSEDGLTHTVWEQADGAGKLIQATFNPDVPEFTNVEISATNPTYLGNIYSVSV